MQGGVMSFLLFLAVFLSLTDRAHVEAWGRNGHYMVCKIAEKYFTTATSNEVAKLLPPAVNGDLAQVCSWADQVTSQYPWSKPLHYANTPQACDFIYSRDCQKDICVVGAIKNYTRQLQNYNRGSSIQYNLTESLMFLAHFVGDVHQPLHVGFKRDGGGNGIIVDWYTEQSNLHSVWDTKIIETALNKFSKNDLNVMIRVIQRNIANKWSQEVNQWKTCDHTSFPCAETFATESAEQACKYAYKDVTQRDKLGDPYFYSRFPIVQMRIAQASVRLANILNQILGPKKT